MRALAVLSLLALAACSADSDGAKPSHSTGSGGSGAGWSTSTTTGANGGGGSGYGGGTTTSSTTADGGGGAAPIDCANPDKRCAQLFSYPASNETSVELRGNFAPDGWTNGIPLVKQGSTWSVTVDMPWDIDVQYKFVIDGTTWITDPANPNEIDNGLGGKNSLSTGAKCADFSCTPTPSLRFAVLGDFGAAALGPPYVQSETDVAALIDGWSPELIVTVGDNNYPDGLATTIDENIGQFYHSYISPYTGQYGAGAATNRFFPCLGNHDWNSGNVQAYLDYFELPGNERYWDKQFGPVHVFCLDSEPQEPDGNTAGSVQGQWLQSSLGASAAPFRLVVAHRPPYSSGQHHSTDFMQWPFADWGAHAVLTGHDHDYERLEVGGIPYVVDGFGGAESYPFGAILPESLVRFTGGFGAVLVEVSPDQKTMRFMAITTDGVLRDNFALTAN